MYSKKPNSWKNALKDRLVTAFMVAPTLAVVLLSAIYQLTISGTYPISEGVPLILGYLSLLTLGATTVLATVHRRSFVTVLLTVLFTLSFLCYLGFMVGGTTDLVSDGFFEMMMLIFSLPLWSYMSVATTIAGSSAVAALVMTGLIALLNLAATVYICLKERKGKKTRGR